VKIANKLASSKKKVRIVTFIGTETWTNLLLGASGLTNAANPQSNRKVLLPEDCY
jgi:hypothetical protein